MLNEEPFLPNDSHQAAEEPTAVAGRSIRGFLVLPLAILAFLVLAAPVLAATRTVERQSLAPGGTGGDYTSSGASVSGDGRYVAFVSFASNLVEEDTNGQADIFVRDRLEGVIERISMAEDGTQANGGSNNPVISRDGRYVAFESSADNLVLEDTNGAQDVFVHDRQTGETTRVSVSSGGGQAASGGDSPAISGDGRYVAFLSRAPLAGPKTSTWQDVFVHDRSSASTELVSLRYDGAEIDEFNAGPPAMSADGNYVVFSHESNELLGLAEDGYPIDRNNDIDIFVVARVTKTTERVTVAHDGGEAIGDSFEPSLSATGRYVAFVSAAYNLVSPTDMNSRDDIYVYDRATGDTTRVSRDTEGGDANGWSRSPSVSADGRYVAFTSMASDLVPGAVLGPEQAYLFDLQVGSTVRLSETPTGEAGDGYSYNASVNDDGTVVAFDSSAANLVAGDYKPSSWDGRDVFASVLGNPILEKALPAGWNLIAGGPSSGTGTLTLFWFTGTSYQSTSAASLEADRGYWLRVSAPTTVTLTTVSPPRTVLLQAGWNLVGNTTSASLTLPAGFTAFVFEEGRYQSTMVLGPGQGAWVRAISATEITLGE